MNRPDLSEVAIGITNAQNILFITGAGISADSGLPTYRGIGGLYEDKFTDEGLPIEVALSGYYFREYPEISWKYLWEIGSACQGAQPNPAHHIITEIQQIKPDSWVLTQNVDGLHRQAGTKNLIEVHGHAFDLVCTNCQETYTAGQILNSYQNKIELPPKCTRCNSVIRPDVILFGELLAQSVVDKMNYLINRGNELVVAIGTTATFPYIVDPVLKARQAGKMTVEINPVVTEISELFDINIRNGAANTMQELWKQMQEI